MHVTVKHDKYAVTVFAVYMTEILPIQRITQTNKSINQSMEQ